MYEDEGVSCFGNAFNNGCESTNGVIAKIRCMHPFRGLDEFLKYLASKMMADADQIATLVSSGKRLSAYASGMLDAQQNLVAANCYRVTCNGNNIFTVCNPQSVHEVSHKVQLRGGAKNINCTPCNSTRYRAATCSPPCSRTRTAGRC